MALTDSHVHLDWFPAAAWEGIVARASEAGVATMVTVGVDLDSSQRAVEIAGRFPSVVAAVGFHPSHLKGELDPPTLADLGRLARSERVVALGEIGLDAVSGRLPLEIQGRAFTSQLRLARELRLPVMLHVRGAFEEMFDLWDREGIPPAEAVVHYFVGDAALAQRCLDRGMYISFGKPLIRSTALQGVARGIPAERLLVETDAYPREANRWTEPADVGLVAEKLAEVRGLAVEGLADILSRNLNRLLKKRVVSDE